MKSAAVPNSNVECQLSAKSNDRNQLGVSRSRRYLTLSLGVIALSQDRDGSSALLPAPPIFNRHTPSVDLYLYRLFNPVAIAARHSHGQGHTPLPSPVEHTTVTRLEAVVTELQAAQTVSFKRVGSCEIDHQGWLEAAAQGKQCLLQRLQVVSVAAAVWQVLRPVPN